MKIIASTTPYGTVNQKNNEGTIDFKVQTILNQLHRKTIEIIKKKKMNLRRKFAWLTKKNLLYQYFRKYWHFTRPVEANKI